MLRLACVLKSGGPFQPDHVMRLQRQLWQHLPGHKLICLSDIVVPCERVKLEHDWPGWWSKMELFRPDIGGDLLFFDLDTVILKDIRHFADICRTAILADWMKQDRPNSSLMYLAEEDRRSIWNVWIDAPNRHMKLAATGGDQSFLRTQFSVRSAPRWQNLFPGQIVSYKMHIKTKKGDRDLSPDARVVCFHGSPRPWEIAAPWARGGDNGPSSTESD